MSRKDLHRTAHSCHSIRHGHSSSSHGSGADMSVYSQIKPSIKLHPSSLERRKFSVISLASLEDEERLHVNVSRNLYTQGDIDDQYGPHEEEETACEKVKSRLRCSNERCYNFLVYFLPIINVLQNYKWKESLPGDIISGVSTACLHFPQGLAYGILASLSPAEGLYSSFFPVLFYVIFGSSMHISMGTNAVIAIIVAELVETEAAVRFPAGLTTTQLVNGTLQNVTVTYTDEEILQFKVAVTAGSTLICGLILFSMGLCKLGFLTTYQSTTFIGGFTTAAAFHIFTSQVTKALGIHIPLVKGMGKIIFIYKAVIEHITETNIASVVLVLVTAVVILFMKDFVNEKVKKKLKMPLPVDLLIIILGTIISHFANFNSNFNIKTVGKIPTGFPAPELPHISTFGPILSMSFEMAILTYFLTIAMAKLCAEKHKYSIDDNQELLAYGLVNIVCSVFHCKVASTAPPRTMILSAMGAKSTLNGVFTAIVLLLVILVLGQFFTSLPVPILAAMIMVAVKPLLLQIKSLPKIYRVNKLDFVIWMSACLSGIFMDLPYGLYVGIGVSFFVVVLQSQQALAFTLAKSGSEDLLLSRHTDDNLQEIPGIKIFRMESSLYFATTDYFKKRLYGATVNPLDMPTMQHPEYTHSHRRRPTFMFPAFEATIEEESEDDDNDEYEEYTVLETKPELNNRHTEIDIKQQQQQPLQKVRVIIIDCGCINYIDLQGVNLLSVIVEEYRRVGITVCLARCSSFMWKTLKQSDFFDVVSRERVFYDLEEAIMASKLLIKYDPVFDVKKQFI